MEAKKLRILFMGTPEIATYSLKKLLDEGYNVVGVVTAPDKPAGRGRKIRISDVKKFALENNLPVLQPENLKSPEFLDALHSLKPDIQVVVAFRILPEAVWSLPPLGTFNMHASLLPDYRGAAPINWVLINGEKETGVTTFLLDRQVDTGKILFREKVNIDEGETAGSLHEKLKVAGGRLVVKTIDTLAEGSARPIDQKDLIKDPSRLKKAPKIFKEDCRINWSKPCREVAHFIHGLSPVPGAYTYVDNGKNEKTQVKLFEVEPKKRNHDHPPGKILSDNREKIQFTTPDGIIEVKSLQISGKKRMNAEEFLRGFDLQDITKPL